MCEGLRVNGLSRKSRGLSCKSRGLAFCHDDGARRHRAAAGPWPDPPLPIRPDRAGAQRNPELPGPVGAAPAGRWRAKRPAFAGTRQGQLGPGPRASARPGPGPWASAQPQRLQVSFAVLPPAGRPTAGGPTARGPRRPAPAPQDGQGHHDGILVTAGRRNWTPATPAFPLLCWFGVSVCTSVCTHGLVRHSQSRAPTRKGRLAKGRTLLLSHAP